MFRIGLLTAEQLQQCAAVPDEQIDALLLQTRFDQAGLDASARAQLAAIQDFATRANAITAGIPAFHFDTRNLAAELDAANRVLGRFDPTEFLAGFSEGVADGLDDVRSELDLLVPEIVEVDNTGRRAAQGTAAWARGLETLRAQADPWARGLANIRAQQEGLDRAMAGSAKGADRVRGALIALANSASGVPGPIGSIISGLLLMSAGSGVVIGVAAGVAVIAAAYNKLREDAREARKATDDFIAGQVQAGRARSPFAEMLRQLDGVPGELEGVTNRLRGLRAELELVQRQQAGSVIGGFAVAGFEGRIAEVQAAIRNAEAAMTESARSFSERVFAEVDRATQGRLAAERAAIQDGLTLEQQGFRAREVQLRAAFEAEAITRQQFTDRRITLAREAAQAEIAAIRREQEAVFIGPAPRTEEDREARRERLDALDRAVQVRRAELAVQEQQIQIERQLAEAAELRLRLLEQQQLRIRAAGGGNLPQGFAGDTPPLPPLEVPVILQGAAAREDLDLVAQRIRIAQREAALFNARLGLTAGILDSIGDGAENLGAIGQQARASIRGVIALVDSLGHLRAANDAVKTAADEAARAAAELQRFTAIGGLIGAGAGIVTNLLGGLLGGDDQHKQLVEENLRQIARNTADQRDRFRGIGGEAEAARVVRELLAAARNAAFGTRGPGALQGANRGEELVREFLAGPLARFGVTLEDLNRIAEQHQLDLFTDKGRLVAASLEQLNAVIQDSIRLQLQLDQANFQAVQEDLALRSRLAGSGQDATERFRQQIEAAGRVGASAVTQAFGDFAVVGEEELRARTLAFLDALDHGLLDPTLLGGLNREDLLGIISGAADHIDSLGESARRATLEMSNIPRGFRQAALAFEAQAPQTGFNLSTTGTINPQGLPVTTSSMDVVVDALKNLPTGPTTVYVTVPGRLESVEELYDKIVEIARRRGDAGDPTALT